MCVRVCVCACVCPASTENDISSRLAKAWTAIDRLSVIWKAVIK